MPPRNTVPLSVLISAYNAEEFLPEALESILNQHFTDFELLIADDGSTDNTKSVIDKYSRMDRRIKCFHNIENIGKTATINKLFKKSTGSFITIHDADDVSAPQRFKKQIEAFLADESLGVCGVGFITIDRWGFILSYDIMPEDWDEIVKNITKASQFHGPTMMIKRSVLDCMGEIYRPYFQDNYEDTDLAFRIIDNYRGYNLQEHLYFYRILDSSLCRRKVDVRNRNLYKVVAMLGEQRRKSGTDFLMENRPEKADKYLDEVTIEYKKDPARIYREAAAYYFHWKLIVKACSAAWSGVLVRPFDLKNIRTLFYIIRKSFLSFESAKTHYKKILL